MPRRALSSSLHPEVGNNLIGIFYHFGRAPDRLSSRKRCARLMSIAVCVSASAVQYAHVPPACSVQLCCLHRLPPRLLPTAYCLLITAYGPPSAACCLRLPPPASRLRMRMRMPPVLHRYRLLLHSAYVHVPLPQE